MKLRYAPFLLLSLVFHLTVSSAQKPSKSMTGSTVQDQAVFFLKTTIPEKAPEDVVILKNGEAIAVKRGLLSPDTVFVRPRIFDYAKELRGSASTFQVTVDRSKGRLCLIDKCSEIVSICPPYEQLERGAMCQSFNREA